MRSSLENLGTEDRFVAVNLELSLDMSRRTHSIATCSHYSHTVEPEYTLVN